MTYKELYDKALWDLEHNNITLGEFEELTEPLNKEIPKEEQTDGDLISRKEVEKCCLDGWNKDYKDILEDIRKLPSSEKTAEWIKQKSGDELFPEEIVCSKCYHSNSHLDFDEHNNPIGKVFLESKYCPNCGAKMKEESEEEEFRRIPEKVPEI